jgi:hypothetical protein
MAAMTSPDVLADTSVLRVAVAHPTNFRRKSWGRRLIELKSTPPVFPPKPAELLAFRVTPPELTGQ